jgi:shikimate kinase
VLASPMVMAPGGGWITNEGVVGLLRPPGRLVHLRISPSEALRRLSRSRVPRPLLTGPDPAGAIEALWTRRAHLYAQADLEIDAEVNDSQRVIDLIVALAHDLTPRLG